MNFTDLSIQNQTTAFMVAKKAGKKVCVILSFKVDNEKDTDFVAIDNCRDALKEQGFSIGSMARDMPIGISKKTDYIAKWYNIDEKEYPKLDGIILSGSKGMRMSEEVFVVLFE